MRILDTLVSLFGFAAQVIIPLFIFVAVLAVQHQVHLNSGRYRDRLRELTLAIRLQEKSAPHPSADVWLLRVLTTRDLVSHARTRQTVYRLAAELGGRQLVEDDAGIDEPRDR
jgi:hypothetical protein